MSMPPPPDWTYAAQLTCTLIGTVSMAVTSVIFIYLYVTLLLLKKSAGSIELNPTMALYMLSEIVVSTTGFAYMAYLCLFYGKQYNAYILYISGALQNTLMAAKPVSVLFLGIDRICCFTLPFRYFGRFKSYLALAAASVIFCVIAAMVATRVVPSFPDGLDTQCKLYSCMSSSASYLIYNGLRFTFSGLNCVIGVVLFVLTKKMVNHANEKRNQSNRLVVVTLWLTVVLDMAPHLLSLVCLHVFGINTTLYFGPVSPLCSSIESLLCSSFYLKQSRKTKKRIIVQLSHRTTS